MLPRVFPAVLALALSVPLPAQSDRLTPAMAEHLLNRAGFGGTPAEIQKLAALGRRGAVRLLLEGPPGFDPDRDLPAFRAEALFPPPREELRRLSREERQQRLRRYRRADRRQLERFRDWWCERMVRTPHPLVEKMVLFWHGHFTSGYRDVRNSYLLIRQIALFRREALGNFRRLLHAVSKDPAMLEYLDNNRNRRGRPNENFAREVMELFTLGLGHYTEKDIKEAARAFTGWTAVRGEFVFRRPWHDPGRKRILGREGRFDGDDVLEILLSHPAAPRHIARKLLHYFVGPRIPKGMVERYAALLRRHRWELKPVLAALFLDDDFYRPEVMGGRIMGPVEFLVSHARRLGVTPPGRLLSRGAALLGQELLQPPNVKGWEGDWAWISTATLLERANLAGYLVTGVSRERLVRDFAGRGAGRLAAVLRGIPAWRPKLRIRPWTAQARSAADVVARLCDRLLAVPATPEAREALVRYVHALGTRTGETFQVPTEYRLRRLCRMILSLPEANLN